MSGADVAPGGLVFYNVSHFYWYFIIFDGDRAIRPLTIIEPGHIRMHRRPPIVESKPSGEGEVGLSLYLLEVAAVLTTLQQGNLQMR
jgi:hypothetical protein